MFRDYQEECIDGVFHQWQHSDSTLAMLATGLGKTVIIAGIAKRLSPKRTIVIAHRDELIFQAKEKIEYWGGIACDVEKAELAASTTFWGKTPAVVASVQSLISGKDTKRMERFKPHDFDALIVDECHHGVAPSYRKILAHFQQNTNLRVAGFTATPDRADQQALGQVFKTVAFEYPIQEAISDGWLVRVEQVITRAEVDFSKIKSNNGDLNGTQLANVMEAEKPLHGVAYSIIEYCGDKKTIVFCCSIKQAESVCEIINRYRAGTARWVCDKTPMKERREMLDEYKNGDLQVVVNVGILLEGFDNPAVEYIVMARPTKSRSLYEQMLGRGLRPLPGVVDALKGPAARRLAIGMSDKRKCTVIDFTGNSGKHKLVTALDILGGKVSPDAIRRIKIKSEKDGKPFNLERLEDEEEELRKKLEEQRLAQEARRSKVTAKVTYRTSTIDPFNALDIAPSKDGPQSNGKTLSERQCALLAKQGIDASRYSYADGMRLFIEVTNRFHNGKCSLPQLATLRRWGWVLGKKPDEFRADMTRKQASDMLDTIAKKQGWKKRSK